MKLILLAAMAALMNAQATVAAKPAPAETVGAKTPSDRLLTEAESLKIENAMLKVVLAQKKFDIEGYQKAIMEPTAIQREVFEAACISVGVAKDKIQSECGVQGFSSDGGPALGPDGKVIPRRVWHQVPDAKVAEKK